MHTIGHLFLGAWGIETTADRCHGALDTSVMLPILFRENWLPITRKDENLDVILRIYVPDLEKVKAWTAPIAEMVGT